MTVRRLDLQFVPRRDPWRVLGWAVLGVGVALAGTLVAYYRHMGTTIAQTEERLSTVSRTRTRDARDAAASKTAADTLEKRSKSARQAVHQLAQPWPELFADLESVQSKDIGLLAIEPDPANRQVRITGEAKSPASIADYMDKLEATASLDELHLTQHEWRRDRQPGRLRFTLVAGWEHPR